MATITENRARQTELYGAPLMDLIHRLTRTMGVSQARLARALGISRPMLSQLVSAQRVGISDPNVLARLAILAGRPTLPTHPDDAEALLREVAGLHWAGLHFARGTAPSGPPRSPRTP
jgi:transcriptional regulator with XRE-family HTH domain